MMRIPPIFMFVLMSLMMWSCVSQQGYTRSETIVNDDLFRTDALVQDSLNTAHMPWRELFTDKYLQGHIDKALKNNLDIRIALHNIQSAEAYLLQSKNAYFPTLSLTPNFTFQTQSLNTQFGRIIGKRAYIKQFDITANMSWEADIWGKLKAQEKAQYAQFMASIAAHQAVKTNLVASVATLYYQLLSLDAQKRIINQTIGLREKNVETTKALKTAGTLTEVAVKQSEALVSNAKASLIELDNQIYVLENSLSLLLGEESHSIERGNLNEQLFPKSIHQGIPMQLLENRPDIRAAELQLISAFEMTNSAKAHFYPSLRLNANSGIQSIDIDKLFSVNSLFASVVTGLAQPILNRRQIKTQYEVSIANREKAYLHFRKTVLQAGKEVSDAMKVLANQDTFIHYKKQEFEAYKTATEYSEELVNYGLANYLEVINANVNSLNAELSIVSAQYTKMKSIIDLYKALGGGWR